MRSEDISTPLIGQTPSKNPIFIATSDSDAPTMGF
jgi:hypothetical protein